LRIDGGKLKADIRGVGLLAGLELSLPDGRPATAISLAIIKTLLPEGFILLPEGDAANVISFTPPLTITEAEIGRLMRALERAIRRGATE
jgi:4-aminobutyrate aminotransferase-like enzyme